MGRIDNETSSEFQSKLLSYVTSAGTALLIDLSNVEYISSAGLRALMTASKQARPSGSRVGVAGLKPVVKEIFEISRFALVVQVFETIADAIAEMK